MGLTLVSRNNPLASSHEQLHRLAMTTACPPFATTMAQAGLSPLHATGITVLQLNVGKLCNQTCRHCHVDAGPERREQMTRETAELCIKALAQTDIPTVDITGGAPELNPNFRRLVEQSRALGRHVMEAGGDLRPRQRRLHAGGHGAARRHQRLELVADLGKGVGHGDHDLALQLA